MPDADINKFERLDEIPSFCRGPRILFIALVHRICSAFLGFVRLGMSFQRSKTGYALILDAPPLIGRLLSLPVPAHHVHSVTSSCRDQRPHQSGSP